VKKSGRLDDDVDELFKLPLAEFIGARDALVKRLKQNGRSDDAALVKALSKPPVSAWTVNQLYWHHRDSFEELLAAGQRFHKAQTSGLAGKVADMRGSLEARRKALAELSDLAASLLSEAGHSPAPDTIRRITTTLEAISAYASAADGPTLGRLSQDVDPPGFESLAAFMPGAGGLKSPALKSVATKAPTAREIEKTRQARIAAAKSSLQAAKKALSNARARAQSFEAAQKKASAEVKQAEKQVRDAEERLKNARLASEAAVRRSQSIADDAKEAAKAVDDAKRTMEQASKELETLFKEAP
jgi:DNA repair exonuclease SbcCD ATPase subunit